MIFCNKTLVNSLCLVEATASGVGILHSYGLPLSGVRSTVGRRGGLKESKTKWIMHHIVSLKISRQSIILSLFSLKCLLESYLVFVLKVLIKSCF